MFNAVDVRKDFPILFRQVNHNPLVYLDNAATTQLPLQVLDRIQTHYTTQNANVHRGIHSLSEQSTEAFEHAREIVKLFISANSVDEIVFTSGTTESINTVASGLIHRIKPDDEILVSTLEHHSNYVPWQNLCRRTGAKFRVVSTPSGEFNMEEYQQMLSKKTRIVAITHVSNLTGTVFPIEKICSLAHEVGALTLIDGAQAVRHEKIDVKKINCDFYCFSGHKIMSPAGIGVLYGKKEQLGNISPTYFGGGMVDNVSLEKTTYTHPPYKFEAGTPNYPGAIGIGEALSYIQSLGFDRISNYEDKLIKHAEKSLSTIPDLTVIGKPKQRAGVISFVIKNIHPYDLATFLDKMGVAVRSGTHCAIPALNSMGYEVATRISPAFYNTYEDIDICVESIKRVSNIIKQRI